MEEKMDNTCVSTGVPSCQLLKYGRSIDRDVQVYVEVEIYKYMQIENWTETRDTCIQSMEELGIGSLETQRLLLTNTR